MRTLSDAFPTTGRWTPEQTKLAFELYCRTPFGQLHGRNRSVIAIAQLIGRTPDAVAMKCLNIASLDPQVIASGRVALGNASDLDREIWAEFHADWERLALECEQLRQWVSRERGMDGGAIEPPTEPDLPSDFTGATREVLVRQRIGQTFFRHAVLGSYGGRCCISGVSDARLLVASHIVPWAIDEQNRLNPSNGLCLSAIHDKAFDNHLFTLDDDRRVVLSAQLKRSTDAFLREVFWSVEGRPIRLPERFVPDPVLLARHRKVTLAAT